MFKRFIDYFISHELGAGIVFFIEITDPDRFKFETNQPTDCLGDVNVPYFWE